MAEIFAQEQDVRWFEEPVSSDDLAGMHYVRQHLPSRMELAAGEYGYDLDYFDKCWKPALSTYSKQMLRAAAHHRLHDGCRICEATTWTYPAIVHRAEFARRLRGAAFSSSGMVSRSRSDRAHAIRWRSCPVDGGFAPTFRDRD